MPSLLPKIYGIVLPYFVFFDFTGVEDLENYHGKALGEKGKAAVELLKSSLTSDGPHGLGPQPVVDDAPAVDLSVQLSEPPSYKIGEKVCREDLGFDLLTFKPTV